MKRLILSTVLVAWCICNCGQNYADYYTYPFGAKDEQWQKYENNKERMDALQIPEVKLYGIPTTHLLEICLDYPFLLEFTFNDDFQEGVNSLIHEFNGFRELVSRKDLPDVLLAKEIGLAKEVESVLSEDDFSKGDLGFKNLVVDLLLLQEDVFPHLTQDRKNELLKVFAKNNEIKRNHPEIFGGVNYISEVILSNTKQSSRPFRSYPDYDPVNIYTPKGSLVPDAWVLTSGDVSYSTTEITNMANTIYNIYNGAQLIEAPTYQYNDKGYAWYKSETSQDVAIGYSNAFADTIYWADKSYIEIPASISTLATKVKYISSTFTAVKEDNSWYVSKWGFDGPLVRHHPTDIPNGYNPSSTKKYYMRNPNCYISGPLLIVSYPGVYSVGNLPAGFTVSWSLSDSYYNQNCLQQNYPSTNQCTITRAQYHNMMDATLTATIKYNGVTVLTETRSVNAYTDFYGQYDSGGLTGTINYQHILYARPGSSTYITSPNFEGATVSYDNTGTIPSYFYFDTTQWKLYFVMPTNNNGIPIMINVNDGCGNYYQLYAMPVNYKNLEILSDDNFIIIMLNEEGNSERGLGLDRDWTVEIRNATTGALMATQSLSSHLVTISTTGWAEGIYVVKATIGKEVLTKKIIVK